MKSYKFAALGGTFDHFHQGHQTLLNHAFGIADKIIVGITADNFILEKNYSFLIEPFSFRQQSVYHFAKSLNKQDKIEIIKLNDLYGPTLTDPQIDCLVVSPLTKPGAELINQKRLLMGLKALPIKVCHLELSSDGKAISSTRIRKGEINRQGFVYQTLLNNDIKLNQKQLEQLKKPFGEVYAEIKSIKLNQNRSLIVTVGDTATKLCLQNNFKINFGVFDNLEKRQPVIKSVKDTFKLKNIIKAKNPSGTISLDLINKLTQAINKNCFVEIKGEEDLTVIPLALMLPLDSIILYGQPNEGIVVVKVTEEKKEWVKVYLLGD